MSKLTAGDVTITLAGEQRVLHPTLRCITMLSNSYGGLAKVRDALAAQDFGAATVVIRWGLNLSDNEAKKLPEQVFATGLTADLLVPLIRFVGILANGGKPMPDDPLEEPDESAEGNVLA
jgi:hypothetical protein